MILHADAFGAAVKKRIMRIAYGDHAAVGRADDAERHSGNSAWRVAEKLGDEYEQQPQR